MKSDDEMMRDIRDFNIFRKIIQNRIHGIKNRITWVKVCYRKKPEIKIETDLINDWKSK